MLTVRWSSRPDVVDLRDFQRSVLKKTFSLVHWLFVANCAMIFMEVFTMSGRTIMNVSLPEPMRAWVEARLSTGEYANASDYVRDLIRHDQARHKDKLDEETRDSILQGIADIRAGRTKPAEEVFARFEAKYSDR